MCRWYIRREVRRIWCGGRIITTANELSKVFGENVRVQILLSDYFEETANCMQMNLEEMTNCIDMELTEFMKYLYEELEKWGKVKWMY